MRIINKSRKIISINNEPFLPGKSMELPKEMETHPSIINFLKKGVIADVNSVVAPSSVSNSISDEERAKIAEQAIADYLEKQKKAQETLENEIKSIKGMKKDELINKALAMGVEAADSDTMDVLKEKIINAFGK